MQLRTSYWGVLNPQVPVPPVPQWDEMHQGLQEDSLYPDEQTQEPLELTVYEQDIVEQLSEVDREMLKSPQERWAALQLPAQLKSQACKKKGEKKQSVWATAWSRR